MERLMDEADPWDFSPEGMYSMISLPAFYGNYLQEYPELAGEREMYALAARTCRLYTSWTDSMISATSWGLMACSLL